MPLHARSHTTHSPFYPYSRNMVRSNSISLQRPIRLFFSYSHRDEGLRNRLETHLSALKREGVIENWHDREIKGGEDWSRQINEHLVSADVVLLLVSANFLASEYCYGVELAHALERHESGDALVIPIILRPVDWQPTVLGRLQALPTDGKPVTSWSNRDAAFLDIARGIRRAIVGVEAGLRSADPGAKLSKAPAHDHRKLETTAFTDVWVSSSEHVAAHQQIFSATTIRGKALGRYAIPSGFPYMTYLGIARAPLFFFATGILSVDDEVITFVAQPSKKVFGQQLHNLNVELQFQLSRDSIKFIDRLRTPNPFVSMFDILWVRVATVRAVVQGDLLLCVGAYGPSSRKLNDRTDELYQVLHGFCRK